MRARGVQPFARSFERPEALADIRARYQSLGPDVLEDERVRVAGRVVLARRHGKLTFFTLRDRSGDLQLFCTEQELGDAYWLVEEIDLGDIIGAEGRVMTTKRGELSVRVDRLTVLTKALRPLPEKWHGLRDPDLQQRKRYLHLIADPTPRDYTVARAKVLRTVRAGLDSRGYVEVETPVLQPVAGGALAKPFTTHHSVLDMDLKLRISLELFLKRLLVGGMERVYEIGRTFRNEGVDREHNPEFTMLELYQAYVDYETMMQLSEDLVTTCAKEVRGTLAFPFRERDLDLSRPWRRVSMLAAVSEAVGDEVTLDRTDLPAVAERAGVGVDPSWGPGKITQELFEKKVEKNIWEPTFVCDFPREVSPLARPHRENAGLTEHFDLVIGGVEVATAFSELTDPDEQREKFELQAEQREAGEEEAHPFDEDFLTALEHGMPPAGGIGIGIDRLLMVLTDAPSLRDLILFPHQRDD